MGYRLDSDGFAQAVADLAGTYRVLAPVVKTGKGVSRIRTSSSTTR